MDVRLKPHYIPLVQKPCCCNVTCLQMILYRNGFELFEQEELAEDFKIKVGKEDKKAFNVKLGTYTRLNYDEGLKTIESKDVINRFFRERGVRLVAKAVKASEISDLNEFVLDNLMKDNDLWVEYKGHQIHRHDSEKGMYIHDGLIEEFFDSNEVIIVDPMPRHKTRIIVRTKVLAESISAKFGRETGFIVISKS